MTAPNSFQLATIHPTASHPVTTHLSKLLQDPQHEHAFSSTGNWPSNQRQRTEEGDSDERTKRTLGR